MESLLSELGETLKKAKTQQATSTTTSGNEKSVPILINWDQSITSEIYNYRCYANNLKCS